MRLKTIPFVGAVLMSACGGYEEPPITEKTAKIEAPATGACSDYSSLKRAYFGDLHVHTSFSIDAYAFGTRNNPADAYRFAKGAALQLTNGEWERIDRPLDFMAVTDHSEGFVDSIWTATQQAAESAYERCRFTSFKGYEYTAVIDGANQHRNVIFATSNVPSTIFDSLAYPQPELLWRGLSQACRAENGCDVIAIPHNSNQSDGQKFNLTGLSVQDARLRHQIEVLAEVFQGKGASECLNTVDRGDSGYDARCEFEILSDTSQPEDAPGYVRNGLEAGLRYYAANGVNPVRVGMIASTDTHNATGGAVAEDSWSGHHGNNDDTAEERLTPWPSTNPGGLAVAWAEENTRESIFAAFRRRETYATSGPRMTVRFYQYWDAIDPCADPSFPANVASRGVPMGGEMTPRSAAPRFVVYAAKDQVNISAIDIVKASFTGGRVVEQIITLQQDTPLGSATMCRTWSDPSYDPSVPSFYYARVFERPTWRWSHHDCQEAPDACRQDVRIQERAWTSPIWSLPNN